MLHVAKRPRNGLFHFFQKFWGKGIMQFGYNGILLLYFNGEYIASATTGLDLIKSKYQIQLPFEIIVINK